ncbi:MAG TPA: heme-binding domain-containing protein [Acidimicrobiales bacterium]
MIRWARRVAVLLTVVGIAIQLVPYGRDHDNPPVVREPTWRSDDVRALAVAACYDCHSNETNWRWYSHVAPMSWLVQRDVERGRRAVNFSEWPSGDEVDDLHDSVVDGEMPPRQYVLAHPDARLSAAEERELVAELRLLAGRADRDDDRDRDRDDRDDRDDD